MTELIPVPLPCEASALRTSLAQLATMRFFLQKINYGKSEDLEIQGLHLAFGIRFHYAKVFLQTAKNIYGRSGVAGN